MLSGRISVAEKNGTQLEVTELYILRNGSNDDLRAGRVYDHLIEFSDGRIAQARTNDLFWCEATEKEYRRA
jgi:hypothetical protein